MAGDRQSVVNLLTFKSFFSNFVFFENVYINEMSFLSKDDETGRGLNNC